ncbi:MAG: hypothetical protein A4E57_01060 [Syntrophorhabdaceae bacterium PtaU1.Bin034]|jgi:hypothetical protein|nr:MAG: hypothetical protein A4E57_01060 [Syntrophorhabdaceae bacterium PtaU1.Bin034]
MITKAMNRKGYVGGRPYAGRGSFIRVEHSVNVSSLPRFVILAFAVVSLVLVSVFFFLANAHEEARQQFMEKLEKEKQVVEMNKFLKMELAAITQKRYVEFAAQERLGLKKAKDEEVVVLR